MQEKENNVMEPIELAEAWKFTINAYKSTDRPDECIHMIIEKFGKKRTEELFATIAAIKIHDGRIYGKNRDYMNQITINHKATEYNTGNPLRYAGLDEIHTTHINQMITELRVHTANRE